MIAIEARRRTVEDYRKLPGDDWRYQLIDGGEAFRLPLFPELEIQTNKIFAV
jgi:hypothetical protein